MKFKQKGLDCLVWEEGMVLKPMDAFELALVYAVGKIIYVIDRDGTSKKVTEQARSIRALLSFEDQLYFSRADSVNNWTKKEHYRRPHQADYLCLHNGIIFSAGTNKEVIEVKSGKSVFTRNTEKQITGLVSDGQSLIISEKYMQEDADMSAITHLSPHTQAFMRKDVQGKIMSLCIINGKLLYSTGHKLMDAESGTELMSSGSEIYSMYSDGEYLYEGGDANSIGKRKDIQLQATIPVVKKEIQRVRAITNHPRYDFVSRGILQW